MPTDDAVTPLTPVDSGRSIERLSWIGLALAVAGGLLAIGGLFLGIVTGLTENRGGDVLWLVLFYGGVAALVAAIGIAILQLVRRRGAVVPVMTILLAFSPVLFLVGLRAALGV